MSIYEIGLLGSVSDASQQALTRVIAEFVGEFGLGVGEEVLLRVGDEFDCRNPRAASAAAYFGGLPFADEELARRIHAASIPIIPVVSRDQSIPDCIPDFLHDVNFYRCRSGEIDISEVSVALLECVGLLRRQRRVFVSYRRIESRSAAVQLHDLLSERGFDVFLDTHDIRPGEPLQEVLWHRLCDSDVMVMLDTPTYFESKWTRQELGRARAKEIHVLRVIWPNHSPTRHTDFGETIYLDRSELSGNDGPIAPAIAEKVALSVEDLRSRSIASRYMSLTGKLRAEVERIGGLVEGIGTHRAISLRLPSGTRLWAYPIVGIPTAELLNDVADKADVASDQRGRPILVYDHVGIRDQWLAHLKWLDRNISTVRAIPVAEAGWRLAANEDDDG